MVIRKAGYKDIEAVKQIYEDARAFMRQSGNMKQWAGGYPAETDIISDIENGILYVAVENGEIACVFCCMGTPEPTYEKIYEGEWKKGGAYRAVHRIAVSKNYHGKGVAGLCFDFALSFCGSVRIDTHRDNIPMQKTLIKNGFEYCGIIYLQNGDERLAYQKTIRTETNELFDILDKDGYPTGKTKPRGIPFAEGEFRRVIHIVILSTDGKMLIQQRQFFKSGYPGQWDVTVGGSALAGETGREAAQRELLEEIGLMFDFSNLRPVITLAFDRGFDDFFVFKKDVDIKALKLQPEEVRNVMWADCDTVCEMIDNGEF
ncbi:MAG: NUDIX domain-containing protein, partial [Clostridia bacterium]|nr:NUDIX domain-containing protein [Clostridia bacterium]